MSAMGFKLHICRGLQVNARHSCRRGRALRQTPHPQATTAARVGVSITAMANASGSLRAYYRHNPFGRYRASGGAIAGANTMRFSSKPWVAFNANISDGLYYYGYRFYDPYLQRRVNRDPIQERGFVTLHNLQGQAHFYGSRQTEQVNLYAYVGNSPMMKSDALGLLEACYQPMDWLGLFWHAYVLLPDGTTVSNAGDKSDFPTPKTKCFPAKPDPDAKCRPKNPDDCVRKAVQQDIGPWSLDHNCGSIVRNAFKKCGFMDPTPDFLIY